MTLSGSAVRVNRWFQRVVRQATVASASAPLLVRKPGIAFHTLATAWQAQVILIVAVVAMIFWMPALVRGFLEWFYPPKDVLFGLSKRVDSRLEQNYQLLMTLFWTGSGALTLLAVWLHIPRGVASSANRSAMLEQKADSLREDESAHCLELYRRARALAPDPEQNSRVCTKIAELESRIGANTAVHEAPQQSPVHRVQQRIANVIRTATRSDEDRLPSAIGQNDRYLVEATLGQGGMGVVYRGQDTSLNRSVAIKGLPAGLSADDKFVSRFHQEAKALAFLSHPCIVQVYDLVEHRHQLWIVLELVEGGDLSGYLGSQGKLPIGEAARLGAHLAGALCYAHAQGVVHRDFKPSNVLLTPERNPKITDFGLAKLLGTSTLTQSGTILGSPHYMSPEQASGRPADERSDAYAFGITMYELMTGAPPFVGDTAGVLAQHITTAPTSPRQIIPEIPAEIDELILGLLRKEPADRSSDLDMVSRLLTGHAAAMATAHPVAHPMGR